MIQIRNLLGRTWFGLLNFGGLLGVIELLTGWAGLAGEMYAGIPQSWSDMLYYPGMPPDPPLSDKALLTRLSFLCEQLESLGIDIAPANSGDRQSWLERLEVLATCARAGRIDAARESP